MDADMILGLRIGLIGLGVTFLALGLLGLVMRYLPTLFPVTKTGAPSPKATQESQQDHLEEMAVALAVGICLLEEEHALEQKDPSLGKLLEKN